ncbi:TRM-domain-containing protein [Morchella conica CCBAS932]|uniref:tRNA (guanine(26)-N(2))-dimethyltransferase n=1 Tax=Morchella conica CCBAS932 TaxID=1392247 RepID=A0A3N4L5I7_9PEZI|nr:TRM-domain-containing protein [Morchella conica CCBAS932]
MGGKRDLLSKPVPQSSKDITLDDGKAYTAVTEGLATVLFPKITVKKDKAGNDVEVKGEVFYNPIQQFNRDLSVLTIKTFGDMFLEEKKEKKEQKLANKAKGKETKGKETKDGGPAKKTITAPTYTPTPPKFTILDALSATGLRALRYALEIPAATAITANDLEPSAVASITANIVHNSKNPATHPDTLEPSAAMSKISYEVIDLDPFGTASPFIDAAVQAVSDGGLLAVTCTDAGVWASAGYSEKCFSLYGGTPVKGEWCHEAGVRLILNSIAMAAARYGYWMEPLLSLSIDFYARVFVRIRKGPEMVKRLASNSMVVYNCDSGCGSWVVQKLGRSKEEKNKSGTGTFMKFGLARAPTTDSNCAECGFPMHLGGPMYAGPLHSTAFIKRLLVSLPSAPPSIYGTLPRITGMLQTALQESTPALAASPFFFATTRLAKTLHCIAPPLAAFRGALKGLGYEVSRSHCKPTSIKTNAPWNVIWEVMRRWVEKKPVKIEAFGDKHAAYKILRLGRVEGDEGTEEEKKLKELEVVFDEKLGADEDKASGLVRYQVNPTAHWGPMAKAKKEDMSKRVMEDGEGEEVEGKRVRRSEANA